MSGGARRIAHRLGAAPVIAPVLALILAAALVLAHPVTAGEAATTGSCAAPPDLVEDDPPMPGLATALAAKRPVTIVAIGGASTAGVAAGDPDKAYPHRLEVVLRRRFPGVPITVLNKAVPRQSATEMVERFDRDVLPAKPTLVLWETGTNDAVRGIDLDEFTATLQNGIDRLHDSRADVMLIDMQFARDTTSVINFQPYLDVMHQVADVNDVYLFRRFEIMRYWSESGAFEFHDVPKSARAVLAAQVYGCLAERMADAIVHAVR